MNGLFRSKDFGVARWQQRGAERLRQALRYLQRLLAADRQAEALALIPVRAVPPRVARQPHQRTWRD